MKARFIIPMTFALQLSSLYAGSMGQAHQPYDFNGFYLGLGSGLTSVLMSDSLIVTNSSSAEITAETNHYSYSGVLFTGNLGYGAMISPKVYLGAKASVYYTPIQQTDESGFSTVVGPLLININNTITFSMKPIYNIDAVLGYEFYPHFLPFVEAGVSFSAINRNYAFNRTRTNIITTNSVEYEYHLSLNNHKTSYNAGIGLNYQPHQHWIFSTELVYNDLGKNTGASTTPIPASTATETQTRTIRSSNVALFGSISYLF